MAQLHYSDQEARRQISDVDHDEAFKLHGDGSYGVLSDYDHQKKSSFNSSPHDKSSESPLIEVHHNRNDPISSDQSSVLSDSGYGKLDPMQPEVAGKASPASGYGRQLDKVAAPPEDEGGYTSLGIEDSEDNSGHSLGVPSEEAGNYVKERGGATPESMAKELEDHSATGEGIIDVHSLKDNYVDLSEGNTNQLEVVNDPALEPNSADGKEKIRVEGFNVYSGEPEISVYDAADLLDDQHESESSTAINQQGDFDGACGVDEPHKSRSGDHDHLQDEIAPQEQRTGVQEREDEKATVARPDKGDDQILVGGDVQNRNQPRDDNCEGDDQTRIDARGGAQNCDPPQDDDVFKPSENVGDQEDSSPKVKPDLCNQVCAVDGKDDGVSIKGEGDITKEDLQLPSGEISRDFSESGANENSTEQFTDHISSPVEQDEGMKVDSDDQDREVESELVNMLEGSDHTSDNINRADSNAESPYTEFERSKDYVKAGYGAEGFVPKHNEEVERELRKETIDEKAEEEGGERRSTDEHPLDKSLEVQGKREEEEDCSKDGCSTGNRASSEGPGGEYIGKGDGGVDDDKHIHYPDVPPPPDVYVRPTSLPHPQPQDLAETNINKNLHTENSNSYSTYEQQKPPEVPHKKGVFEKIKDKLTPPYSSD